MGASKKVGERLIAGLKRFQPILQAAKARDLGESDTVTIVTDMLAEVFGYDKYAEITSEFAIRGTSSRVVLVLDLDPRWLSAGGVRRIYPLRDNALLVVPRDFAE